MLAELAALVATEAIDLVVVTGDLFDTAAPSPDAQRLAWDTLLTCRSNAAQVIVIAGNHDSPDAFDAVRPVSRLQVSP